MIKLWGKNRWKFVKLGVDFVLNNLTISKFKTQKYVENTAIVTSLTNSGCTTATPIWNYYMNKNVFTKLNRTLRYKNKRWSGISPTTRQSLERAQNSTMSHRHIRTVRINKTNYILKPFSRHLQTVIGFILNLIHIQVEAFRNEYRRTVGGGSLNST